MGTRSRLARLTAIALVGSIAACRGDGAGEPAPSPATDPTIATPITGEGAHPVPNSGPPLRHWGGGNRGGGGADSI